MTWLTLQEVIDLGVPRQTLNRRIKSLTWESRLGGRRGSRNGTAMREVKLESLPRDLQIKYLRSQSLDIEPEIVDESSLTTEEDRPVDLAPERKLVDALKRYGPEVRTAFQAEAQRLADIIERYDAIKPKRLKLGPGKFEFVPAVKALCTESVCGDAIVLSIEPKRSRVPSPHTLDLWSKWYKADGLAAFLRKPNVQQTPVDNRRAEVSSEAIEWMNANVRSKPSPWALYKAVRKEGLKRGWQIPAYGWVYRQYKNLPGIVRSGWFDGEKKYAAKYGVYVPRTVEDITALQILCGDHSVRDVTVMLPDGQLTRPWLTTWQDMRTGLIWGWHLDLTPSSNTIGLAYVNGVQNFGAQPLSQPEKDFYSYLYTDQGKDYRSKTLTGQTLEFKKAARIEGGLGVLCTQRKVGFMEELGIKHIMARGYNAKEKPVERYHKDVSAFEQNTFRDEYCGKDTVSKPDRWVKAYQKHQRLLKKFGGNLDWLRSESPFMSLDDYRDNLAGWINEYNHETHTRSVLGGSKVVPIDEYNRLYTTRYEISEDALALLLMKAARRKIGKNGVEMLNGQFLHEAMSIFKGEEIEVRYSDGDYSRIWAVLPDGQVVEAPNLTRSSILNPNKKTMEVVSRQRALERNMVREFRFIQESNYRGETAEDRVARLINPVDEQPPEQQRMAVNAGPQIHNLTRFDKPTLVGSGRRTVTAADIENVNVIEGMFSSSEKAKPRIKDEWED